MSREDAAVAMTSIGKLVSSLSPMLATIPTVGPILAVVGELAGSLLTIGGGGVALSAQQEAAVLEALRAVIETVEAARAQTARAEAERDAETQRVIDEAKGDKTPVP